MYFNSLTKKKGIKVKLSAEVEQKPVESFLEVSPNVVLNDKSSCYIN